MKEALVFLTSIIIVSFIIMNSCSKEENYTDFLDANNSINGHIENIQLTSRNINPQNVKYTVLGRKRNNPFSVTNMTIAYNFLYETNLSSLPVTHYYVKFSPNT